MNISKNEVEQFYQALLQKEHSRHTAEKYRRDALGLVVWLNGAELTKEKALAYKQTLMENYQVRSVNSMLSAVNAFFAFLKRQDLQLKTLKLQRQTYLSKEKELTKGGKALDRSNIWKMLKALCKKAKVAPSKVFPHNLRHLFARTYYRLKKDIVRLADVLGHSSIDTTRIYTMETGEIHRRQIERLGLLQC